MITDPVENKSGEYKISRNTNSCCDDRVVKCSKRGGNLPDLFREYQGVRIVMNVIDFKKLLEQNK